MSTSVQQETNRKSWAQEVDDEDSKNPMWRTAIIKASKDYETDCGSKKEETSTTKSSRDRSKKKKGEKAEKAEKVEKAEKGAPAPAVPKSGRGNGRSARRNGEPFGHESFPSSGDPEEIARMINHGVRGFAKDIVNCLLSTTCAASKSLACYLADVVAASGNHGSYAKSHEYIEQRIKDTLLPLYSGLENIRCELEGSAVKEDMARGSGVAHRGNSHASQPVAAVHPPAFHVASNGHSAGKDGCAGGALCNGQAATASSVAQEAAMFSRCQNGSAAAVVSSAAADGPSKSPAAAAARAEGASSKGASPSSKLQRSTAATEAPAATPAAEATPVPAATTTTTTTATEATLSEPVTSADVAKETTEKPSIPESPKISTFRFNANAIRFVPVNISSGPVASPEPPAAAPAAAVAESIDAAVAESSDAVVVESTPTDPAVAETTDAAVVVSTSTDAAVVESTDAVVVVSTSTDAAVVEFTDAAVVESTSTDPAVVESTPTDPALVKSTPIDVAVAESSDNVSHVEVEAIADANLQSISSGDALKEESNDDGASK